MVQRRDHLLICALGVAWALSLGGCEDGGLEPAEALALVEPHTEHFETFDRWARRALAADPAFRNRESLEETVFAPVRREDAVYAIWIEREQDDAAPLSFGHYERPPKDAAWTQVRHEDLGPVEVAAIKLKDPRRRLDDDEGGEPCVVLSRQERTGAHTVVVTIAYLRDSE